MRDKVDQQNLKTETKSSDNLIKCVKSESQVYERMESNVSNFLTTYKMFWKDLPKFLTNRDPFLYF